jgi:diguanylate cyclase (GGDEF)-like protein
VSGLLLNLSVPGRIKLMQVRQNRLQSWLESWFGEPVLLSLDARKRSQAATVAMITVSCMLMSLLITYLILLITDSEMAPIIFIIAAVAPGIIAPVTTWFIIGLTIQLQELEQKHLQLATYDDLTGLLRRQAFLGQCQALLDLAQRSGRPLTFATLDLDAFKSVNDSYGHSAGDLVLQKFASTVRDALRASDLAGRLGGEEFAIVLPDTAGRDSLQVLDRIRSRLDSSRIVYQGQEIHITVSIGVAETDSARPESLASLAGRSDMAMYQAKTAGRNQIVQAGRI